MADAVLLYVFNIGFLAYPFLFCFKEKVKKKLTLNLELNKWIQKHFFCSFFNDAFIKRAVDLIELHWVV